MGNLFSASERVSYLQGMTAGEMDLIVIGGGIAGASIAWDASLRGMNVGLLEMNDFASGTSSRLTKLVHGGLRYLKRGDVRSVREAGRERSLLQKRMPHIVKPLPMLLPIYKSGTHGYFMSSIGIYIYDRVAGIKPSERRKMLSRNKTMELEPLLKEDGLKGSGHYYEYQMDDARLTIEIIKSAKANGARLCNYAKVVDFLYRKGKISGVEVEDTLSGKRYKMYAKKIVNATGPWLDHLRKLDHSLNSRCLQHTKDVHLVVDYSRLPVQQATYVNVTAGRDEQDRQNGYDKQAGQTMFVIPRGDKTYFGMTDTLYEGDPENPIITEENVQYLLDAVNEMYPNVGLKREHIESGWVGLRPLIREEGKTPQEVTRKDEILVSKTGLISIIGGKLTGFRKLAEKSVNLVAKQLEEETNVVYPPCTTDRVQISSGEKLDGLTYEALKSQLIDDGARQGLTEKMVLDLISRYGSNTQMILDYFRELNERSFTLEERLLYAEIMYSVNYEMTVRAVDFLLRRTSWMLFDRSRAERLCGKVIRFLAEQLGWNQKRVAQEWALLKEKLEQRTFTAAKRAEIATLVENGSEAGYVTER